MTTKSLRKLHKWSRDFWGADGQDDDEMLKSAIEITMILPLLLERLEAAEAVIEWRRRTFASILLVLSQAPI